MGIIKYINGNPLFSTAKEALDYARDIGFKTTDVHVHRYKVTPGIYRSGFMPGKTHEEHQMFIIGKPIVTDPRDPRDPRDPVIVTEVPTDDRGITSSGQY
tara:strand:- start:356 stop:655 length:300 start_codon:yes stop_codon:yes gene_type:complete